MGMLWDTLGLIEAGWKRESGASKGQLRFRQAALKGKALQAERTPLGKRTEMALGEM